ncbi:ArsR/SmtB family transcription factor [Lacrimispora sp. 38-1]|uniref:ArsR/SmtB family transcription factor n=1 Tax=Lacrimispora sp. 38-1 TaxID=3125778 RepID=UPI003CFA3FF7
MFQVANGDFSELFKSCMPLFIALGDEVRLTIIEVLAKTDSFQTEGLTYMGDQTAVRGMNVNEITDRTSLSRPAISHHLKILKEAGLVSARQEGTANYYFLTFGESTKKLCTLGQYLQNFMDPVQIIYGDSGNR